LFFYDYFKTLYFSQLIKFQDNTKFQSWICRTRTRLQNWFDFITRSTIERKIHSKKIVIEVRLISYEIFNVLKTINLKFKE
jgi:hypothetical protein